MPLQNEKEGYGNPSQAEISSGPGEVPRNPTTFRQNAVTVAESKSPFEPIVSYNEWGEGTAVESATAWASPSGHGVYLDILHQVFGEYPR